MKKMIKLLAKDAGFNWLVKDIKKVELIEMSFIGEGYNRHVFYENYRIEFKNGNVKYLTRRAKNRGSANLDIINIF